jgi:lipopolysaccharide transport system ATP-binding protein
MTDIAVRVDNLGKRYRIGIRRGADPPMLGEVISNLAATPFTKLTGVARRFWTRHTTGARRVLPDPKDLWAIRHLSFEVPRGQIIGIIGPNGAGKSTLLKILSRITEPTEGRVEIKGRVGSLLEVGTGFHPELTGRENIYFSAALLGMRKAEIDRNLDEIIAFAEIEKFADTPVKHYSSGMYVRLAFSVAAHLEPEILIVDEVLAVGDAAFQRKCLNKMEDVKQHGRTILFVSHNMQPIVRLCERAILISRGAILKDGPAVDVASAYLATSLRTNAEQAWLHPNTAPGDHVARLRRLRVHDESGNTTETIDIRQPIGIEMTYDVLDSDHLLWPHLIFYNGTGLCLFTTFELAPEWRGRPRPAGRYISTAWIPGNHLAAGAVLVDAGLRSAPPPRVHFFERHAAAFHIVDTPEDNSARGDWVGDLPGVVRPLLAWNTTWQKQVEPEDG